MQNQDFEYNREWYKKILLVKKTKERDSDHSFSFKNDGCESSVINQKTFSDSLGREFREFRLIEIVNEKEVMEHASFVHSFYPGKKQRFYFDDINQFMLEKLSHPRVFLYKMDQDTSQGTKIKWHLIKRFAKFPEDLES